MSQQLPEEWFVRADRTNAVIAWMLVALLVGISVLSVRNGLLVHATVAGVAAVVAVVPAVTGGDWTRIVSWPLLLLASLPLAAGAVQPSFFRDVVVGLSIATLAMLVVVALQLTTTVRMTPGFAIVFVVLTTLATTGFWTVGSAASAAYLGTRFVETNDELMVIFTAALLAGVTAGLVFRWYFRRQLAANLERGPDEGVAG
ncbi:hypothetical protein [Haloferax sp. ATB1]|uniref:hypothetical protein n=1 Tax=Haloferax sp. ATB1 TaxID=1508454 RepID=UPI0006934195|nr:hypothetical protein [Haloferax sp. ATB1]